MNFRKTLEQDKTARKSLEQNFLILTNYLPVIDFTHAKVHLGQRTHLPLHSKLNLSSYKILWA